MNHQMKAAFDAWKSECWKEKGRWPSAEAGVQWALNYLRNEQEPVFWYRKRSDGGYEGPIHHAEIEEVRRNSGAWVPLYAEPKPVTVSVTEGWKLVPVSPTHEMALAGKKWVFGRGQYEMALRIYSDMLATAPQAATTEDSPAVATPELAGRQAAVTHLSRLFDEQRALLVEVEDVCGKDAYGGELEDGESELIDRIRAHLSMTNDAPSTVKDSLTPADQDLRRDADWY